LFVCLTCGNLLAKNIDKHYNEKGHYAFLNQNKLICKKCNLNIENNEFPGECLSLMSEQLYKIANSLSKKGK